MKSASTSALAAAVLVGGIGALPTTAAAAPAAAPASATTASTGTASATTATAAAASGATARSTPSQVSPENAPASTRVSPSDDPSAVPNANDFVPFVLKDGGSYWAVTPTYSTTVAKPTWQEASEAAVLVHMPARGGSPAPIAHEVNDALCFGAPSDTTVEYTFGYDNCTNPFRLDTDGKLYRVFGQYPQRVGVQGQGKLLGGNIGNSSFVGDQPEVPEPSRKPVIRSAEQLPDTNNIQLNWSGVSGVSWWVIDRDGAEVGQARGEDTFLDKRVPVGKHTYTVHPYWPDEAEASDPYTVNVEDYVSPSPVRDLTVSAIGRHEATLNWTEPVIGLVTSYLVELPGRDPMTVESTELRLTDLEAGATYSASVTAQNPDGHSAPSRISFTTDGVQRLVSGWQSTSGKFYALTTNTDGTIGYSNPYSTKEEAAAAGTDLVLPDLGTTGRITDTAGNCLVVGTGKDAYFRFISCAAVTDDQMSEFSFTPGGRLTAPNGEYLALVWSGSEGAHAVLKSDSNTYFTVMDRP
ncbi:fibronectin type III domain-containing protein [Curtobacterium ammoniigenes]|uniref:fibronectin type III domain-containing protein n=1 Tax=Curtobacterium ammoniigenes TaxID=395387 RepID=UPI0008332A98|nr:fibronectin type III domain-containing protein [Curtobacterium ammoniigenes]